MAKQNKTIDDHLIRKARAAKAPHRAELFDPEQIESIIKDMPAGSEEVVYIGRAARCDVDLCNSSMLVDLLMKYGHSGSFFTDVIKKEAQHIVKKNNGYWLGSKGDSAEFMFGDLEKAVRCTVEITYWVDRELTEYVKDNIVAREMLKQEARLTNNPETDGRLVMERVYEIRDIKNKWDDAVPTLKKKLKDHYEIIYTKIDDEIAAITNEKRGRITTKTGIAFDDVEFHVEKSVLSKDMVEVQRDPQGPVTYLISRMTDKSGPLGGKKDTILIGSYSEIPNLPEYVYIKKLGKNTVANTTYYLYETFGVDNFKHPSFDNRIPEKCRLKESLPPYRVEIFNQLDFLKKLQRKNRDASIPWLDVTHDDREGTDRYKKDRTLMGTAVVLGIIDEVKKIYETVIKDSNNHNNHNNSYGFLDDVSKDAAFTSFYNLISEQRDNIILAALTYNNGGSMSRANSDTPKYPTRGLNPKDNLMRIVNERKGVYSATSDYSELVDKKIPDILKVQDESISKIAASHGYELAMTAMVLKIATRYVHHTSYRSWKLPVSTHEEAIYKIRSELSYLLREDRCGYKDNKFELIERAFIQLLGIKPKSVPFK